MAPRGRPRLPEGELKLKGTYRKDRHAKKAAKPKEPESAPVAPIDPPQELRDYVGIADGYARAVVAGEILACKLVVAACQKFLADREREPDEAFPYWLDADRAVRVCAFVESMPHVKGKWARDRERIRLEPWQCFVVANVFGWISKKTGLRRYRRVYVEVPRKNAKSTLTAALANYMLTEDEEHGAEVYSGATTEKQAWEVFGPARLMALGASRMTQSGVAVGAKNLHVLNTASKFEPIIGKPGDGASPSFSITDEYHEHATSEQYDTMVTGMGAREQPIAWVITTAGSDTAGPCYALRSQAVESLEGKVQHDELFGLVYTVDEGIDWTSEDALRMANPNMGVSVFEEFLRTEQARAVKSPREQSTFKTKHLNVWVTAASPFFNAELLRRLGDPKLSEDDFVGEPCVASLDLASKLDIAGSGKLFLKEIDDQKHYYWFGRYYVPQSTTEKPENRHYAGWAEQGYLIVTPGETTSYDQIEADIKADGDRFTLLELGVDPWNATQMMQHLQDHFGADKIIEVPQTAMHLSNPMKEVEAAIVAGRFHHDGNPCFEWMMGNVTAQVDRNDNVFPRKERPEKKIDGALMAIIAMGRALSAFENAGSVYGENRGLRVL